MKREESFAEPRWDDPFWHVVRMLADQFTRGKYADSIPEDEIIPALKKAGTPAASGLVDYLSERKEMLGTLSHYWARRRIIANEMLSLMRTEEEAKEDFFALTGRTVENYNEVKLEGYHKSPKVLVSTVDAVVDNECASTATPVDKNPQSRAAVISRDHILVTPRRLDGAIPSLFNPVALWEIKEYWGKTKGGSKMSDAIYEIQLVGTELRTFEDEFGIHVNHYAILDGRHQWSARKSDLRRSVDLLYTGLLDEIIVGREVLKEWPRIVRECCNSHHASSQE
ncbi:hypothetical protein [Nocardiopsis sp. FR4]|uniref:DUF7687 domain-containing protein n=1 Tax=Nocardiopsis sp. FR4 TaxID=2605985 RepID=UPI00135C1BF2|nr:hypothetical protein [Nocardiopsis sp. FR4]